MAAIRFANEVVLDVSNYYVILTLTIWGFQAALQGVDWDESTQTDSAMSSPCP